MYTDKQQGLIHKEISSILLYSIRLSFYKKTKEPLSHSLILLFKFLISE
jgi:hypothetical protein